jgi:hypothetical protein
MRRFNYDENEEYREDVDKFFSEEGQMDDAQYKAIMEEEMQMQQLQIRFVYRDLNHRVLRSAIRMCEKSLWWWFYSQDTRLRMIDRAYKRLRKLEEDQ